MSHTEIIRRLTEPLEPMPTEMEARCAPIEGLRALFFDVYGTLLISASGDISLTSGAGQGGAIGEALASVGIKFTGPADGAIDLFRSTIGQRHAESSAPYPEVEIREVWEQVLHGFQKHGWIPQIPADIERMAIEYEMRVNPVWTMPGMEACLETIRHAGLPLGIVSNAQFFTLELFPALVGQTLGELRFSEDLSIWSYEHGEAKPGRHLYDLAVGVAAARGLAPSEILYVGNDMRNDIAPATQVGFRTALFAGDARSLRLRRGDPLARGVTPDAVVTDLRQIPALFRLADA